MDENPMPETLDTIAAKLTALGKTIDERFVQVDQQFAKVGKSMDERFANVDQQLAETKAQLGVKIEAVDEKVVRVYDAVIAQQQHTAANEKAHATFTQRLDNHDIRILALEPRKPDPR